MVFCGKPSSACHACRERKTRCDQLPLPEGCTQCRRTKRECPGYRQLGDLVFRDSTSHVIKKAKARAAKEKQNQRQSYPSPVSSDGSLDVVQQGDVSLSVFALAPTVEDRAVGFFVTNFVLGSSGPSKGNLGYLIDITRSQVIDEWLDCSMKAVGLSAYAHAIHAPDLVKNAQYQYIRAIQATNRALRDPENVKKDSTLLSILVLGIFETVAGKGITSLRDWNEHLNGAAAVIKIRGIDQIKSLAGRRMVVTIGANLLTSCLVRGVALQKHMREYMDAALAYVKDPDPALVLICTMSRIASFRADVVQHKSVHIQEIISQALELDGRLLGLATASFPGWDYEIMTTESDSQWVFQGRYHVYHDSWMAQVWNILRVLRILLNEIIRGRLLEGFSAKPPLFSQPEYTAQFQVSTNVLYEMQLGILCSVPSHVGLVEQWKASSEHATSSCLPGHDIKVTMAGASFLLWPLWTCAITDLVTEEVRNFVIKTLLSIAEVTGVNQARVLADVLTTKMNITDTVWKGEDAAEHPAAIEAGNFRYRGVKLVGIDDI